jgi:hypothetical protein
LRGEINDPYMGPECSPYDKKADDGRKACRHLKLSAAHIMALTIRQPHQNAGQTS